MAAKTTEGKHKVLLPLSKDNTDDVWVCVNGVSTQIKRGVEVEVSDAVYEVLQNTQRMESEALRRSMELRQN